MAARNKNMFSILQSELNPSDRYNDNQSEASSEGEYLPYDESDLEEEYFEEDLRYKKKEFELKDKKLLNEEECLHAIHQDKYTARD